MKTLTTKPRVYIGEAETDATKGRYIGIEFIPAVDIISTIFGWPIVNHELIISFFAKVCF